jgi:hypothetical protein
LITGFYLILAIVKHTRHTNMENEKKIPSRRKFVFGFGVLSVLAAVGITVAPKKTILGCGPLGKKKTVKMLTQDGKLVEIEEDKLTNQRKKITDEELKSWVKKS